MDKILTQTGPIDTILNAYEMYTVRPWKKERGHPVIIVGISQSVE